MSEVARNITDSSGRMDREVPTVSARSHTRTRTKHTHTHMHDQAHTHIHTCVRRLETERRRPRSAAAVAVLSGVEAILTTLPHAGIIDPKKGTRKESRCSQHAPGPPTPPHYRQTDTHAAD